MHECSTATESHLCCFLSSGGKRSGVEPYCAAHSAAPQVRAGHCPCGGQHLWVLQRSLSQPVSFLLAISFSYLQLPGNWTFRSVIIGRDVTSNRAKDLNLRLELNTLYRSGNVTLSQNFPGYMDRITVWLSYTLEGVCSSLEMRLFPGCLYSYWDLQ